MRQFLFALGCGCITIIGGPRVARAQGTILHATVADAMTGDYILDASVTLDPVGLKSTTDFFGDARFISLRKGRYTVHARRIGYTPNDVEVQLSGRDSLEVTLLMIPVTYQLAPVKVEESATSPFLKEFEERRKQGNGQYITDSTLRASFGSPLENIITSRFRGLRYLTMPGGGFTLYSTRGTNSLKAGLCPVAVYWNGIHLGTTSSQPTTDASMVPVDFIGGIEYYNAGTAPVQYQWSGEDCGVLLLWPRP